MKIVILALLLLMSPLHAQEDVLRVAVNGFLPPFVMQGAKNQLSGFDIEMMEKICKYINRRCQFEILHFQQVLGAVENKKVDIAVGSIVITAERSTRVNFSLPYLLSYLLFLGPQKLKNQPFGLPLLNNRKIGIERGTIFAQAIQAIGVKNATIVEFDELALIVEALHNGKIELALMDAPSALYWQSQTSNLLAVLGEPFVYGYGIGIAVNRNDINLLQQINKALLAYQNSGDYIKNYNKYMVPFKQK